jgi:GTP-binding protein Era
VTCVETRPAETDGPTDHRCGFVAIVGRPNAGKSTLLNRLLGQKLAGVTPKPQTTRRRLLGIKTLPRCQMLLLDTPGIYAARDLIGERMVEHAKQCLRDADVALWVVDAGAGLGGEDRQIVALLEAFHGPVVVALNKIDRVEKRRLLPLMGEVARLLPASQPIPISALAGENLATLLGAVEEALPPGPAHYPADELTDASERAVAAEIIRERVMVETHAEVPYAAAVTVDAFEEREGSETAVIRATIHVERASQRPIVVGRGGARIKAIGRAARLEIENIIGRRVYLELFVRVQEGWTKSPARLEEFGL